MTEVVSINNEMNTAPVCDIEALESAIIAHLKVNILDLSNPYAENWYNIDRYIWWSRAYEFPVFSTITDLDEVKELVRDELHFMDYTDDEVKATNCDENLDSLVLKNWKHIDWKHIRSEFDTAIWKTALESGIFNFERRVYLDSSGQVVSNLFRIPSTDPHFLTLEIQTKKMNNY